MKLSIITINLNNKVGLQKTIDSVIAQTYKNFEWIIIDGGSTDGSKELIEKNAKFISYWVSELDKGIFHAMNKGIRISHGDYLLFLNSGDFLYSPSVLLSAVVQLQGADLYIGQELRDNHWLFDPNMENTNKLCEFMLMYHVPHQSTFICRKLFDIYGLYDEEKKIASDWCFFYQTIILGKATVKKLPFIVSVFNTKGISTTQAQLGYSEKVGFLAKIPRFNYISEFYRNNYEFVTALKHSRIAFFLFRIYFFFYRKGQTKYNV